MWFFGLTKAIEGDQPKRPSILGTMFNPRIGDSLRPLGETTSVFVQLIAMVFAMNGLFPKDHPAIRGVEGARLTLSEIFGAAWNSLRFTKEGLPKVILFFAVTGTMIFAVLSVITALLAGFMGTAHADTGGSSSGFFSSSGPQDLGQNWLDYIFKGVPLSDYYSQTGAAIPQSTGIQCAMISALGFYSQGMLVFAAVILFYHLVSMVVNTAHEGVPMGKRASQVWAPIRLVVAVGLLVPMGSGPTECGTTGAGLNAGQYIVIQMASWGSGLASQTWATFINALQGMQYDYIKPNPPSVYGVVTDIVKMEACKFAWNYQVCLVDVAGGDTTQCANPNNYTPQNHKNEIIPTPTPSHTDSQGGVTYIYTPVNMMNSYKVCGSFYVPGPIPTASTPDTVGLTEGQISPAQTAQALSQAEQSTFQGMMGQFATVGANVAKLIPEINDGAIPPNTDFTTLVSTYQKNLKSNLDSALSNQGGLTQQQATTINSLGWAAAGAWLNTIARDQGAIVNAYRDGLPKTQPPQTSTLEDVGGIGKEVAAEIQALQTWLSNGAATSTQTTTATTATTATTGCSAQAAASAGATSPSAFTGTIPNVSGVITLGGTQSLDLSDNDPTNPIDVKGMINALVRSLGAGNIKGVKEKILAIIDYQAQDSGVWAPPANPCSGNSQYFTLGAQLVTANPLAELSFWGYANLSTAYAMLDNIVALALAGTELDVQSQIERFHQGDLGYTQQHLQMMTLGGKFYDFASGLFGMIAMIFFACGYTLAFVVPLLPFFRFFFNVLTWIVSVLEAVVAVPLIALAHLNPEGEGLPGQSAKAAYFMVFNIFLRPVMTVFGLVAGLLVFYVAIMLLNMTYSIAVAGTLRTSYAFGIATLIRIIYTLTYGATAYVCANNAFKTIGAFPEHAVRWIGAQAHHERMGDGGRAVQGVMGQAQGYLGEKAVGLAKLRPPN